MTPVCCPALVIKPPPVCCPALVMAPSWCVWRTSTRRWRGRTWSTRPWWGSPVSSPTTLQSTWSGSRPQSEAGGPPLDPSMPSGKRTVAQWQNRPQSTTTTTRSFRFGKCGGYIYIYVEDLLEMWWRLSNQNIFIFNLKSDFIKKTRIMRCLQIILITKLRSVNFVKKWSFYIFFSLYNPPQYRHILALFRSGCTGGGTNASC